ncbi:DUF2285 domain-containing protein [Bradyrhizobium sp. DASA03120]|uniref:DUF2285 domain-containing protein n=1 Tax=Bradyrhizobium sp. SMVTL-02 TaxID=3395917 RepID=UPI003F7058D2
MVLLIESVSDLHGVAVRFDLADLSSGSIRQAADGWHAVLRIHGTRHHLRLKQAPRSGAVYSIEQPTQDSDYEIRARATLRLLRAINDRPPGPPIALLSAQRRKRLALSLRALDGHMDGASYRAIAEVLFGPRRISEQAWKTHPLRGRIIRLLKAGLALMRGGYRALLRPSSRKE